MDLYKDIWILILKYLKDDLKSLTNFTKASKFTNILANDNGLWQYFCNKFNKDEIIEYKEKTWKEIYKMFSVIKTIKVKNDIIILKGNNRCYYSYLNENENQLKIYDPKEKDKLLNIINIYYRKKYYCYIIILSDNNRLFYVNPNNFNLFIYELKLSLEINDIIINIICVNYFDFIIIKNLNIYKIYIYGSKQFKLVFLLNYNIININKSNDIFKFEYLDDNNELQSKKIDYIEITNFYNN